MVGMRCDAFRWLPLLPLIFEFARREPSLCCSITIKPLTDRPCYGPIIDTLESRTLLKMADPYICCWFAIQQGESAYSRSLRPFWISPVQRSLDAITLMACSSLHEPASNPGVRGHLQQHDHMSTARDVGSQEPSAVMLPWPQSIFIPCILTGTILFLVTLLLLWIRREKQKPDLLPLSPIRLLVFSFIALGLAVSTIAITTIGEQEECVKECVKECIDIFTSVIIILQYFLTAIIASLAYESSAMLFENGPKFTGRLLQNYLKGDFFQILRPSIIPVLVSTTCGIIIMIGRSSGALLHRVTSILLIFVAAFDTWHTVEVTRISSVFINRDFRGELEQGRVTKMKRAASWFIEGLRLIITTLEIFYGDDMTRRHIFAFIIVARMLVVILVNTPLALLFCISGGEWELQISYTVSTLSSLVLASLMQGYRFKLKPRERSTQHLSLRTNS
ncbi:uncharacterized protein PV09_09826 [Verruconis gallopava]|uniref:Uncharacterized protein n=1 Tax=Verruconis gallopava TaxID=253628 RepID=A0A0D1X8J5_9PEZI|nr:uncharacterized protein PV09_09826 [Verruconis gallopava]KIV98330.1 hypothetical protein PV09_09826 [Verruconis gallopava]